MAGTTRVFQSMLNEYLSNDLLREEFMKRDYFLKNVEKDNSWMGGDIIVPFKGATASTVEIGQLEAQGNIAQSAFVRGKIVGMPEAWGSLIFNERDLMEHGKISEQNFLKLLPGELEDHLNYFKTVVSLNFTNGKRITKATVNGTALGILRVERPERLVLGMKVNVLDDNTAATTCYITAIDMVTGDVELRDSRAGIETGTPTGNVIDLTVGPITVAQNARLEFVIAGGAYEFNNIRNLLLPAAAGGSATIHGQTKLAFPYLQSIAQSGASITAVNLLEKIFDHVTVMRNRAAGMADKVLMSYKHWGTIMKLLEGKYGDNTTAGTGIGKGIYRQASDATASLYGWEEVQIAGPRGRVTVVAIQELEDDVIYFMDMSTLKIHSNGFFKKRMSPDGQEYFVIRNQTGYQYIIDDCFFGDITCLRPSRNGALYSISY